MLLSETHGKKFETTSSLGKAVISFLTLALAFSGLFITSGCFVVSLGPQQGEFEEKTIESVGAEPKEKILMLEIDGVIDDHAEKNLFKMEESLVTIVREKLKKARKDESIKGVVLRINSPGGSATASDIIHREIAKFKRERNIPVVACMMDMAASGGYYIASAADKIMAHPTTVTGSIGVIFMSLNAEGLLGKVGLQMEVIKAGDKKDIASPFRKMTDEERGILQKVVDETYERFVTVVKEGRPHLTEVEIRGLADGRIFTAKEAQEKGLVDEIGYLPDALEMAMKEARLQDARLVVYVRPGEYRNNFYSHAYDQAGKVLPDLSFSRAQLEEYLNIKTGQPLYLWVP
jgi:protease-4